MGALHLQCAAEPVVDAAAVIVPRLLRIGADLEAIILKTLAVLGEGDATRLVVREASPVEALVGPPKFAWIEPRLRHGAWRQQLGVERSRLEHTQAR